jgi:hypothetical protein
MYSTQVRVGSLLTYFVRDFITLFHPPFLAISIDCYVFFFVYQVHVRPLIIKHHQETIIQHTPIIYSTPQTQNTSDASDRPPLDTGLVALHRIITC